VLLHTYYIVVWLLPLALTASVWSGVTRFFSNDVFLTSDDAFVAVNACLEGACTYE
jgi:hypothetical protein